VISISLIVLLLASNVGFSLNTHFCGGQAVKSSFTLGLHQPDCGMADMDRECQSDRGDQEQVQNTPCCENEHQILQLDENVDLPTAPTMVNPIFISAFVYAFVQPPIFTEKDQVHSLYYPPLVPDRDTQALFQTYLI